MRATLLLEEMTWPEVEAALADGFTTIVVAVDPRGMSREIGERCIARTAEGIAASLRDGG